MHDAQFIARPYTVATNGMDGGTYFAASRGKALGQAWRAMTECGYRISFRDFLKETRVTAATPHWRVGEPIHVCGKPGFFLSDDGHRVRFVRPWSDVALFAHPDDVRPVMDLIIIGSHRAVKSLHHQAGCHFDPVRSRIWVAGKPEALMGCPGGTLAYIERHDMPSVIRNPEALCKSRRFRMIDNQPDLLAAIRFRSVR